MIDSLSCADSCVSQDTVFAQGNEEPQMSHSVMLNQGDGKKHPWRAAAETIGLNVFVNCFDKVVLSESYAEVTIPAIRRNFKECFVWDYDGFPTNFISHPYHGGLYFNTARSNGLNFWESIPYALGGSLTWEFFGETDIPSINDLIATSCGGFAFGEVTHRLSSLALDDGKTGFRRVVHEFLGTVFSPMRGLNRILTGRAWKVNHDTPLYHDYKRIPVNLKLSVGDHYLADNGVLSNGEHIPYLDLLLNYGDKINVEENKPYDYFDAGVTFGFNSNQPLLNRVQLLGRLGGWQVYEGKRSTAVAGIFQYFNYLASKAVTDSSPQVPYRIFEAASFGPGMTFLLDGNRSTFSQSVYISGVLLGGSVSDYYKWIERDYNMGSGFSTKLRTELEVKKMGIFKMLADYYLIATWKGYEQNDMRYLKEHSLDTQGDKSTATLLILSPSLSFNLGKGFSMDLIANYSHRLTRYNYRDNVKSNTFEMYAGLAVTL